MARTEIPVTSIVRAGASQPAAVYADITNNHQVKDNTGRTFLELVNVSNAGSVNVTFDIPYQLDGDLTVADLIVALSPGAVKYAGPWKTTYFNQATESAVYFDVGSTGISFRAYKLQD